MSKRDRTPRQPAPGVPPKKKRQRCGPASLRPDRSGRRSLPSSSCARGVPPASRTAVGSTSSSEATAAVTRPAGTAPGKCADASLVRRELAAPQRACRASRGGHLHPRAVVGREERQRAARRAGLRDDPAQLADRLVHLEQRVAVAPRGRPVAEAGRGRERHVRLVEGDEEEPVRRIGLERRTSCSWPRGDVAEPRLGAAGGGEHKLAREGEVRGGERSDVGGLLRDRLVGEQRQRQRVAQLPRGGA